MYCQIFTSLWDSYVSVFVFFSVSENLFVLSSMMLAEGLCLLLLLACQPSSWGIWAA